MNFCILNGHVGADPQIKKFENDRKVMTFTMATTKRYKAQDGSWKDMPAQWHNVQAWGYLADIPVDKGAQVEVKGEITYRKYTDKDGVERYITDIVATDLHMVRKFAKVQAAPITADMDPMIKRQPVTPDGFTQPAAVAAPDGAFFKYEIPASASPDTDLPF